jgi:serine/threonine protein kinase
LTKEFFALKILNNSKLHARGEYSPLKNKAKKEVTKEIEIMRRLSHPNVIALEKVIEDDFKTYVIMEYVDGSTLKEVITQQTLTLV